MHHKTARKFTRAWETFSDYWNSISLSGFKFQHKSMDTLVLDVDLLLLRCSCRDVCECSIPTCIMWSSLVISTASWQWSRAVKTELQALWMNKHAVFMYLCLYVWLCGKWCSFLGCTWVWTGSAPPRVQSVWAHCSRLTRCCFPQTSGGQTRLSVVWRKRRGGDTSGKWNQ